MNIEDEIQQMRVIKYPHPTLRRKSKPVVKVDRQLKLVVDRMFELMYEHKGIGLAANQVDLPFQLFVLNLEAEPGTGTERVFINPVVDSPKGNAEAEEGCLSLPGVYGKVVRPEQVRVQAYGIDGRAIDEIVDGLQARVIQHEFDHLQGMLFVDRLSEAARNALGKELEDLRLEFDQDQRSGSVGSEDEVESRLTKLEKLYCGN